MPQEHGGHTVRHVTMLVARCKKDDFLTFRFYSGHKPTTPLPNIGKKNGDSTRRTPLHSALSRPFTRRATSARHRHWMRTP
jgi:hypothetical protein